LSLGTTERRKSEYGWVAAAKRLSGPGGEPVRVPGSFFFEVCYMGVFVTGVSCVGKSGPQDQEARVGGRHNDRHVRSCALLMDSRITPGHEIPMFAGERLRTHLWE
jgi:hypothetical protein